MAPKTAQERAKIRKSAPKSARRKNKYLIFDPPWDAWPARAATSGYPDRVEV